MGELKVAVVSKNDSGQRPYPYVFVNGDATIRELHQSERGYLEQPFSPTDGARPYVKRAFNSRDGSGSVQGFLHRSQVPNGLSVAAAPIDDPSRSLTRDEILAQLSHERGLTAIQIPDGSEMFRREK
jgi:hypothetical protein